MPRKKPAPKDKGGRPAWEPTPEQRKLIRGMAQHLVPQSIIAECCGVTTKTLRAHCREELDERSKGLAGLVSDAYKMARREPAIMRFLLVTQCGYSATRDEAKEQDERRFAHEERMLRLRAELAMGGGENTDFPLLPAIYEESEPVKH